MWRELVSRLFDEAAFQPPATTGQLQQLESTFSLTPPGDLRSLLLESNGVAVIHRAPLVWSTVEMIEQNRLFCQHAAFPGLCMPFDCLFFFGAEGNGDQFAYRTLAGRIRDRRGFASGTTSSTIDSGLPMASRITWSAQFRGMRKAEARGAPPATPGSSAPRP